MTLHMGDLDGNGALDSTEFWQRLAEEVQEQCGRPLLVEDELDTQFQILACIAAGSMTCDEEEVDSSTHSSACSCVGTEEFTEIVLSTSGGDTEDSNAVSQAVCDRFQAQVAAFCSVNESENGDSIGASVTQSGGSKNDQSVVLVVALSMLGLVLLGLVLLYYFWRGWKKKSGDSQTDTRADSSRNNKHGGNEECCSDTTTGDEEDAPGILRNRSLSLLSTLDEVEQALGVGIVRDGDSHKNSHTSSSSDGYFSTLEDDDSSTQSHPIDIFEADDDDNSSAQVLSTYDAATFRRNQSRQERIDEPSATFRSSDDNENAAWAEFQLCSTSAHHAQQEEQASIYKLWAAASWRSGGTAAAAKSSNRRLSKTAPPISPDTLDRARRASGHRSTSKKTNIVRMDI